MPVHGLIYKQFILDYVQSNVQNTYNNSNLRIWKAIQININYKKYEQILQYPD